MTRNENAAPGKQGGDEETRRKRCRNYGATPRALQGQVLQAEPCSALPSADPRSISHSPTLIAIAACIARGARP